MMSSGSSGAHAVSSDVTCSPEPCASCRDAPPHLCYRSSRSHRMTSNPTDEDGSLACPLNTPHDVDGWRFSVVLESAELARAVRSGCRCHEIHMSATRFIWNTGHPKFEPPFPYVNVCEIGRCCCFFFLVVNSFNQVTHPHLSFAWLSNISSTLGLGEKKLERKSLGSGLAKEKKMRSSQERCRVRMVRTPFGIVFISWVCKNFYLFTAPSFFL
jgi:hypothetical protein